MLISIKRTIPNTTSISTNAGITPIILFFNKTNITIIAIKTGKLNATAVSISFLATLVFSFINSSISVQSVQQHIIYHNDNHSIYSSLKYSAGYALPKRYPCIQSAPSLLNALKSSEVSIPSIHSFNPRLCAIFII